MTRRAFRMVVCATIHFAACGIFSGISPNLHSQVVTTKGLANSAIDENVWEWIDVLTVMAAPVGLNCSMLRNDGDNSLMAVSINKATRRMNELPQLYSTANSTPARIALRI